MIKDEIAKESSSSASYQKGERLYRQGAVHQMECSRVNSGEQEDFKIRLSAKIDGHIQRYYDVSLIYNTNQEKIEQYSCTCPAYYEYRGMCKHCTALAMSLMERGIQEAIRQLKGVVKVRQGRKETALAKRGGVQKNSRKRKTTEGLREILDRHGYPLLGEEQKKVHIQAFYSGNHTSKGELEFKIGIDQMYILKNIRNFAESIKNKRNVRYGKKLEFVHNMNAFTEECRPLLRFIMARADRSSGYYGYYHQYERCMQLDADEVNVFFELMAGQEVFIAGMPVSVYKVTGIETGEETGEGTNGEIVHLEHKLRISGEQDGITVSLDQQTKYISAAENPILWDMQGIYVFPEEFYKKAGDFLMFLLKEKKCFLAREDVPVFVKKIYPVLKQFFIPEIRKFVPDEYLPPKPGFLIYLDAPEKNVITCTMYAAYVDEEMEEGHTKYNVLFPDEGRGKRDLDEEVMVEKQVSAWFQAYDREHGCMVLADDDSMIYQLLRDGIIELQKIGEVFVSDAVKRLSIQPSPHFGIGISLSGDILSLSIHSEEMSMEELAAILSKYDRKKRFIRLRDGQFIDIDRESMDALYDLKEGLMLTDSQLSKGKVEIPKYRAMYLDQSVNNKDSISVDKNRTFRALIRNMKTVEDSDFEVPESLQKILRKYQKDGFLWMKTLHENGFGGLLADDMGLGKTLQVIAFLLSEYPFWKEEQGKKFAMIVCPASLVYNWESEIERFAPELETVPLTGNAAERKKALLHDGRKIYIVSYDLLRRDIEMYEDCFFGYQIIDEAQYIKVSTTQKARSVKKIHAGFRLALTGTPMENRLSELWSIFDYLMPGFLYSYQKFRDDMEAPIVQKNDKEAMKRIQKMIRPFLLRRLKKDVLKDLPDKLEENVFGLMEGEQKKLYEAHVQRLKIMLSEQSEEQFNKSKIQILAELTRLRQLCCDPSLMLENYHAGSAKLELCMEMVENAVQAGHKILLFSQFTTMLEHLEKSLDKRKISHFKLTGSVNKEKRAQMVKDFNEDDTSVFLISLKAGGTGLNLTAADIVLHYDPWWNVAAENQASDRAHRIGQKNVVTVYKLIMKDTIEENIIRLQERKKELAEQVLGGDGMSDFRISREELLEIL